MRTDTNTHIHTLHGERVTGIYSSKLDVSITSLTSELKEVWGRGGRNSVRDRGIEVTRRGQLSESTDQGLCELIKGVKKGPTEVCTRSSLYKL